jgi:hypothetical protein
MTYEEKQNRWKTLFSDNELNVISSALYSQLQYSLYTGEAAVLYEQIANEIARRRAFMYSLRVLLMNHLPKSSFLRNWAFPRLVCLPLWKQSPLTIWE